MKSNEKRMKKNRNVLQANIVTTNWYGKGNKMSARKFSIWPINITQKIATNEKVSPIFLDFAI